jgi:hypothetical protein
MKRIWIDEHHEDGEKVYETESEALAVIMDILEEDVDMMDDKEMADFSINEIFEIGRKWYGIFEDRADTPCCDKQDLEFNIDGRTDGLSYETWTCANCETHYTVPIEIVRDWDNIEEIN